ncbi:MAG TPA: hypothetical protein PLM75_13215, partial [bacterium]|nr:hypothetical protein [bacterium]
EAKSTTTIFGLNTTYYMIPKNSITPYLSLEIGRMDLKSDGEKIGGFCYGGSFGIGYFITKTLGLDLGAGYLTAKLEDDMDYSATAINLGFYLKI